MPHTSKTDVWGTFESHHYGNSCKPINASLKDIKQKLKGKSQVSHIRLPENTTCSQPEKIMCLWHL